QGCCVCGKSGATIACCCETGCHRRFHLPCAAEGKCVTQYFPSYRAFCEDHSPRQTVEVVPERGTSCLLCLEVMDEGQSYHNMVCPTCQHAWLHRACAQGQALRAGTLCFVCPLCRDKDAFQSEMLRMGIRVPRR
ncbi:G2E3 ligase, partial [Trogon melanurus]|nr:G2E3 ligase [Trogon melanurus]